MLQPIGKSHFTQVPRARGAAVLPSCRRPSSPARFPARVEQPVGIRRQGRAEPQIPRAREEVEMMAERSVKKNSQIPSAYGGVEAVGAQRGAGYTTPLHGAVAGICLSELLSCANPPCAWGSRGIRSTRRISYAQLPRVRGAVARRPAAPARRSGNSPVCVGQTAGDRRCACVQHATPPRARSRRDAHCTDYIGKKQLPSVRGADEGMKRMLSVFISNSPACVGQTALQTHSERISKAQLPRARGAVLCSCTWKMSISPKSPARVGQSYRAGADAVTPLSRGGVMRRIRP